MKYVVYYVVGLLILSAAPALIMGIIFTVGVYYLLYNIFKGGSLRLKIFMRILFRKPLFP